MAGRTDLHGRGSSAERARRKAHVDGWRDQYGDWCPGYLVPGHPASDLTADHVVAVALGGDPQGELGVLCRSCNGRKGKNGPNALVIPSVRSRDWLSPSVT